MQTKTDNGYRILAALSASFVLLFATTGQYAFGDNIHSDIAVSSTELEITAGNSGVANYFVQAIPTTSCDPIINGPVTFNINIPSITGLTRNPSSLTLDACGTANGDMVTFQTTSSTPAGSYEVTIAVTDANGGSYNVNPAKFTLKVIEAAAPADTTAPIISYTVNGLFPPVPDGLNGWYTIDADLVWSVTDDESAVTSTIGCDDTYVDYDTSGETFSCEATSDGGSADPVSVTIKRDAADPYNIAFSGGALTDGGSYYFGFVPDGPTSCTAEDDTSGFDRCDLGNSGGDLNAVGSHYYTATAYDVAGNEAEAGLSYTILAWTLDGFFRPVEMDGIYNLVKAGQTVPLKFKIFAGDMELTDASYVKSIVVSAVACEINGYYDPLNDDAAATGGTGLRYDADSGQFIHNWRTPMTKNACYEVTLTTQDESVLTAKFRTKS